ncbi:hypothetical protein ACWIG4_30140 [Streptomyces sp. NPDC002248]
MSAALGVAAVERTKHNWADTVLDVGVEALEYAKANAPWEDRTGDARDGLDVDVDDSGNTIVLSLFHTVDYGQWLETIQNGRFAIIMPTLEIYGQEIKRRIEG